MKSRITFSLFLAAILGMGILFTNIAAASDVVIITNKSVQVSSLSSSEIQKIFIGKKGRWSSAQKVIIVTLAKGAVHKEFLSTYVKKTPKKFSRYWKKLVFTGRGKSPKSVKSESAVIEFVANTKGAIGYVSKNTNTDNVKIIEITD